MKTIELKDEKEKDKIILDDKDFLLIEVLRELTQSIKSLTAKIR